MSRILMLGAFGQRNVGDEALCSALCAALADHDVVVASSDPALSSAAHQCEAIPASAMAVVRELGRSDLVVVGGGTVFKALHPSSGRRRDALLVNTFALTRWARWRGVPVAFVGVGAGELSSGPARRMARRIVTDASLLVLRDEESASVLTSSGVTPPFWIGADPAWQLFAGSRPQRPPHDAGRRRAPSMTIALSHLTGGSDDDVVARLATALQGHVAGGWQIRLQPWQSGRHDLAVAERLLRHVPSARLEPMPVDLTAAATRFAHDDLVVAMRFHALVAAGAAGTPSVAIAHEPKLAGLARRLDQIAVPPDASTAVIATALDWATTHAGPSNDTVGREIELAGHTVRLMQLLADGGRLDRPEQLPALQLSDGGGRW
jgi:polysaccharide pyruvyl transferase WcaK-like protein